jgi:hypothetical protein
MTYTIKLDQAALHIVGVALGRMPHGEVAALIAAIQQQINAQEQAARTASAADTAPLAPPAVDSAPSRKRRARRDADVS